MSAADLTALLPIIMLTAFTVVVMLTIAVRRNHWVTAALTLTGLAAAFASLAASASVAPRGVTPLLVADGYALFYSALILAAAFVVTVLLYGYLEDSDGQQEEMYLLLLTATLGAVVLVYSRHFASFFLGMEVLSVSLFAMIGYPLDKKAPLEAALKYLVLAGVASAFLLFGMALVYNQVGTLAFAHLGSMLQSGQYDGSPYLLAGVALVVVGIAFKLSVVPFHLWTPDVYEGAPAPVTAYLSTVSKGAMFALLLRYFMQADVYRSHHVMVAFSVLAIASMLIGNLLALLQNNVKRLLAYSSIAHMGYLLVAFMAGGTLAVVAVSYYLAAYFVMTLGAFGVVTVLSRRDRQRDADHIADYQGLFWQRPVLAGVFTLMLLSLAGIPLTMGFLGKFYALAAGVQHALWAPVIALAVGSIMGLFYYLRLIVAMFRTAPEQAPAGLALVRSSPVPVTGALALTGLAVALVWLGIYPSALLDVIHSTAAAFM
ncbi:MAG: NADH-quinone oxidoreductase subunit N [Gammaproteobacteria bacterium]